jgi:hypothetical protein
MDETKVDVHWIGMLYRWCSITSGSGAVPTQSASLRGRWQSIPIHRSTPHLVKSVMDRERVLAARSSSTRQSNRYTWLVQWRHIYRNPARVDGCPSANLHVRVWSEASDVTQSRE